MNRRVRNNERTMLNIDGKIVQNPQTLAETFDKYFSHTVEESVIKTMKQNENDPYIQSHLSYVVDAYPKPIPPIQWKPVTRKELVDISKSLKGKKSYGYDEIPSWIVKLSMPLVIAPLIYICNKMLFTGTFPSRLKFAQISPVFKKGNNTEMTAYRPISVLNSFSKIFEKVIYNRLLLHTD